MRATGIAALFLAFILALTAFDSSRAAAQTGCGVSILTSNEVEGRWTSDCPSKSRENSYARYYSLRVTETAEVTITLESDTDPYLYLFTEQGEYVDEDDDAAGNYNSRITRTLEPNDYTIEATTYDAGATDKFNLTVDGIGRFDDRAALVALYNATDGDNWNDKTKWLTNAPLSDWHGVTTDQNGRVAELHLSGNGLIGPIPPDLSKTQNMVRLDLSVNGLTGDIPSELGGLTRLEYLNLELNLIEGTIPQELGNLSNLKSLNLRYNRLTETVPAELGNLSQLEILHIKNNRLWGALPHSLTTLTQLHWLEYLENSGLCAPDDAAFKEWLQSVWREDDSARICVPESTTPNAQDVAVLTTLYDVTDGDNWSDATNWFSEQSLQYWKGVTINTDGRVTELDLDGNELSGRIPAELGDLYALERLSLGNKLTGAIPAELGNLVRLDLLDLSNNQLTSSIPTELGNLTNLKYLALYNNQLTDAIPPELGNLTNLDALRLDGNQLTGHIPSELGNLSSLTSLNLGENQLSGGIPTELGNLVSLTGLRLEDNQLTGDIPSELGNLVNLKNLELAGNRLTGCIPDALRDIWHNDLDQLGLPFCGGTQPPPPTPTLPACVERMPDAMTVGGEWTTDCKSSIDAPDGRGDRYAKFYAFALDAESDVTITLSSDEVDTFLYLRSGISTDGTALYDNDDYDYPDSTDSRIVTRLDAGEYTVEATTYTAGITGSFTLTAAATPVSTTPPPQPPPPPTPPDSPIPAGCDLQTFSGASVDDSWTSDCVSRNRTENGTHYAKFFGFSVDRRATIDLTLQSRVDTYLLLLSETGEVIKEDDDDDDGVFNLPTRNSGIRIALDPGNYIAEATTFAGETTGDFTLSIGSPELAALRALYDATDGANWTNDDNWFTDAPLSDWYGIKTDDEGRITEIYLIGNNLNGEIPAELGLLSELEGLYLARNDLSGTIPSELGNLSSLETLMLFDNDLTGAIPYQFGNMESLEQIHMGRNKLSGRIPRQLGNLANLQRLHLTVNELSGNIPSELGNLTELRQLSIAANNLTGAIPAEIASLSELTHIYLWGNDLTAGAFIRDLDKLDNLQFLDIGGNRIDGRYALAELSALDNLTGLGLHASDLSDADLAAYMGDLQALNLEFLNLSGNYLSDPQILVGLSGITTLQRLAIHGNDFRGELPRTMTRLTLMRLFYFHDNDGLCAPADTEFQDWFTNIRDRKGPTCVGGTPAHAPVPAPDSADQFAAALQAPEHLAPQHSLSALAAAQPDS